jgi:hypothetical protein
MIELLLIAITWYLTKLYYTKDPLINIPEDDSEIVRSICAKCARTEYIHRDNLRAPNYCMSCK